MVKERKDEPKDDKKPKKESDLKKFLNKRSFIYLSAAVFFVVFIVPDMIAPSDLEKKLIENLESDRENIAWNIVKSYRGSDDSGYNLFDAIITQRENAYPTEKILTHNDTMLTVSAEEAARSVGHAFYEVHFTFKTYNAMKKYIWNVNIETEEIIPLNDGAKKMMNIVDFYD